LENKIRHVYPPLAERTKPTYAKASAGEEGESDMKNFLYFMAIMAIVIISAIEAYGATATASIFLEVEPIEDLIEDIETNIKVSTASLNDYYVGETMLLTAIPSDLPGYTYTWYKDDAVVSTESTYEMIGLQPLDAGVYSVQLKNQCGDTSIATTLEINIYPRLTVTLKSVPEAMEDTVSVASCDEVIFTALTAGGKAPLTYEWSLGTTPINGDTDILTISPANSSNMGQYSVAVSDAMGREPDVYSD
jgi:hypothetical protein